jgi:glutathionylspermidine synthase
MVRDKPAAICLRETLGSIISAQSAFVPHAIERQDLKPSQF